MYASKIPHSDIPNFINIVNSRAQPYLFFRKIINLKPPEAFRVLTDFNQSAVRYLLVRGIANIFVTVSNSQENIRSYWEYIRRLCVWFSWSFTMPVKHFKTILSRSIWIILLINCNAYFSPYNWVLLNVKILSIIPILFL